MRRGVSFALAAFALALAPAAKAGPTVLVGATEDVVKHADPVVATAQLNLARLAGFNGIRVSATWWPGQKEPDATEIDPLRNVVAAARLSGMRVILSVSHFGSRTTPLTEEARAEFTAYAASLATTFPYVRDFIVGNEPNLNRFWMPQFGLDGSNEAAPAYLKLLAETYDALKKVSPSIRVIGGALAPRGVDRANTGRDTHSPTKFIRDMGTAYRESGRTAPVMDAFAIHPYGDSSSQAPSASKHPNTKTIGLADYDKLVALLAEAFDGTAQRGATLPIFYDEYGVETKIPAAKARLYTGKEAVRTKPVDEATQAAYYRDALQLAYCQPNVAALLFFHVVDEPQLDRWQSGVFYRGGIPKTSLVAVRDAVRQTRGGVVAHCPGLALNVKATVGAPRRAELAESRVPFRVTCDVDCAYSAKLQRVVSGRTVATVEGIALAKVASRVRFPAGKIRPGLHRVVVRLVAPVNPGAVIVRKTSVFRIRAESPAVRSAR